MASFRTVPLPQSEDEFLRGADERDSPAAAPAEPSPSPQGSSPRAADGACPWDGLEPRARPTINQTVRLNPYQHAQLAFIAEAEERSLSQVLRRVLGPALEQAVRAMADRQA